MRKFLVLLISLLTVTLICTSTTYAGKAEFRWDMANEYAVTSVHAEADNAFIKKLEELSEGRIKITYHPGASLGYKSKDQWDAVGDGAIPLANTIMGPLRGIDPIFLLSSLPFVTSTIEQSRIMLEKVARPYYDKILKQNNQIFLYASPWPPSGIWSKSTVKSIADLKKLKIRTYDPNGTLTFKAAKSAPIQLTWADVVPQLSTGGINSVLTSAEGGCNAKYWDFLTDFASIKYCSPLDMAHMNADIFNDLPEDLQAAVLKAADFANEFAWKNVQARVEKNFKEMKSHNIAINTDISPELSAYLQKSAQVAVDAWIKKMGPEGEKILDQFYTIISK
jgi:TRAP-type transport system periplasmic protein